MHPWHLVPNDLLKTLLKTSTKIVGEFIEDCKFLLDKNELQHSVGTEDHEKTRLDKANAVIDIMSSPLSLVAQINVTDRMHILKVSLLLQGQAIVPMQLVAHVTANLFYWPLIQLAAATTHNIVLGVSVGSKGGGNLPGATLNITLLLLLIGKCTADPNAFTEVGREDFFRLRSVEQRVLSKCLNSINE
ncbi:hypothetical protein Tco_1449213 [Tanacetum coccineum]